MEVVYSYGGSPFKRDGDGLWSSTGRYLGKFRGDMVYGRDGRYLGELRNDRLAHNPRHANRQTVASSRMDRMGLARMNRVGRVLPAGWEDFPG